MPMLIPAAAHAPTIWAIVALATVGVLARPWRLPEAIWPLAGAVLLVGLGLLPFSRAMEGAAKSLDVCLFLSGMMLLGEIARHEGLFDWLAAHAASYAKGSAVRLFILVYGVGTLVTIFLSNDAAAVILTPAVAAVAKAVEAKTALPFLFICAFIANAASFVLPVSNPANLVIYGSHMPRLGEWLMLYGVPSLVAIVSTFAVLYATQHAALREPIGRDLDVPKLSKSGKLAGSSLIASALLLMLASAADWQLGTPTFIAGAVTAAIVLWRKREDPRPVLGEISWSILALVAGFFILFAGLEQTPLLPALANYLTQGASSSLTLTAAGAALASALAANLMNNLPAGLTAASAVHIADAPRDITAAVLIGIDLGPNLSVTGSLATLLWLAALRREGHDISAWTFLKLGVIVTIPALLLTTASLLLITRVS